MIPQLVQVSKLVLNPLALFCSELGTPLYVVGGFVRDLFIELNNNQLPKSKSVQSIQYKEDNSLTYDIDILTLVEIEDFVKKLKRNWCKYFGSEIFVEEKIFPDYRTAKLFFPSNGEIARILKGGFLEIVAARKETYHSPAKKPEIQIGSLREDILRRDFSINSLAVDTKNIPNMERYSLGTSPHDAFKDQLSEMEVLDIVGGRNDLEKGLIRILHPDSFRDDPCRVIRALRFEQRLGFEVEKDTFGRMKEAVSNKFLELVDPQRKINELKKVFSESNASLILAKLNDLDLLKQISSSFCEQEIISEKLTTRELGERGIYCLLDLEKDKQAKNFISLYEGISKSQASEFLEKLKLDKTREA